MVHPGNAPSRPSAASGHRFNNSSSVRLSLQLPSSTLEGRTASSMAYRTQQGRSNLSIASPQGRAHSFSMARINTDPNDIERRPSEPPQRTQLSIAERFMNPSYSTSAASTSPREPMSPASRNTRLSSTDRERSMSTLLSDPTIASSPTSLTADPDPHRLTIASAFMRRSPTSDAERRDTTAAPESFHPLDKQQLDDQRFSQSSFRLDLSLPSPVASLHGRNYNRHPWGSQDTLVQGTDKKYNQEKQPCSFDIEETEILSKDEEQSQYEEEDNDRRRRNHYANASSTNGCWLGCCFVSCTPRRTSRSDPSKLTKSCRYQCGQRGWVFGIFIGLFIVAISAYVLWPRTPLMRIEGASLISGPEVTMTKQGTMVGNVAYQAEWLVNVTVDNRQNAVPTRLVGIQVIAKDALTGMVIGKGIHNDDGDLGNAQWFPARSISVIQLPIAVDYQARDETDTTFADILAACTPQSSADPQPSSLSTNNTMNNGTHTITNSTNSTNNSVANIPPPSSSLTHRALQLHFWITLRIFGLEWFGYRPTLIATPANGGFSCPLH